MQGLFGNMKYLCSRIRVINGLYTKIYLNCENQLMKYKHFFSLDYILWLKSLRLHKYAPLFSKITYDNMFNLAEKELESKVSY